MEIVINEKRRKSKVIGIRLYKEEYDLISGNAKKKKVEPGRWSNRQSAPRWEH